MTPSKQRYRKIKTRWLRCGKRVAYYQCRITGRTFALPLNRKPLHPRAVN